jgi:hypothetical protein
MTEVDVDRAGGQLCDGFVVGGDGRDLDRDAVLRFEGRDNVGIDIRVVVHDPQRPCFGLQAVLDPLGVLAGRRARAVVAACLQQREPDGERETEARRASDDLSTSKAAFQWSSPS